jgi:hypothetical protein
MAEYPSDEAAYRLYACTITGFEATMRIDLSDLSSLGKMKMLSGNGTFTYPFLGIDIVITGLPGIYTSTLAGASAKIKAQKSRGPGYSCSSFCKNANLNSRPANCERL